MKEDLGNILIKVYRGTLIVIAGVILVFGVLFYIHIDPDLKVLSFIKKKESLDRAEIKFENGFHQETGLIQDSGVKLVIATCTRCHSAKLVTQNRATREGWKNMIRWMQQTQNLWDLGENEDLILDYLAKNYAPGKAGRRAHLEEVDWYLLK